MSEFIHFEGISFNRNHIIVISGSSIRIDTKGKEIKEDPHFTIYLAHDAPEWVISAKTEKELLAKRSKLIKLFG